jgi:hypothetical protein
MSQHFDCTHYATSEVRDIDSPLGDEMSVSVESEIKLKFRRDETKRGCLRHSRLLQTFRPYGT